MTFEKWLEDAELESVTNNSYTQEDLKTAWNAAINKAQMIAWEYARGTRIQSGTCTRSDDIAEDIKKLESK